VIRRHPIASRRLAQINNSDLCSYRDQRLRQVKRNTLVREFGLLRTVVSTAIDEWGITVDNPLKSFHIKREPDQRLRRLSRDELEQLISAECNNPYTKPMILLALETAMRLGELLSLKWSRVDLDRGFAELQKTKNGHGRMVPLTAAALFVLSNLERDVDVVFPVKSGTLKQSWVRLVKRAGISDLRFHDLRHEAISRLLEKGLTIPEAASVSGHKTASMLLRYAHPDPVKVRQKMMS
jgi:integrase